MNSIKLFKANEDIIINDKISISKGSKLRVLIGSFIIMTVFNSKGVSFIQMKLSLYNKFKQKLVLCE